MPKSKFPIRLPRSVVTSLSSVPEKRTLSENRRGNFQNRKINSQLDLFLKGSSQSDIESIRKSASNRVELILYQVLSSLELLSSFSSFLQHFYKMNFMKNFWCYHSCRCNITSTINHHKPCFSELLCSFTSKHFVNFFCPHLFCK